MTTNDRLNLTAILLEDAGRLLSATSDKPVTAKMLASDIAAGAPANSDGTLNLIHYAAWLVQDLANANKSTRIATE